MICTNNNKVIIISEELTTSIKFAVMLAFIILFLILIRKYRNYQEKPLIPMIILSLFGIINSIIELLRFKYFETYNLELFISFLIIYGSFRMVFAFAIVLYFEYHQFYRVQNTTVAVFVFTVTYSSATIIAFISLFNVGTDYPSNSFFYFPHFAPFIGIGLIYAVIKFIVYWKHNYRASINDKQALQLKLLLAGFIIWFLIPNLFIGLSAVVFTLESTFTALTMNIILPTLFLVGIILFIILFSLSNQVIIPGLRFVDNIMIIDSSGLPWYSYKFSNTLKTEEALLTGGLSAVNAVLREAIGVESQLQLIKFKEKEVVIYSTNNLGFILISDHNTQYLEYALGQFGDVFSTHYGEISNPNNLPPKSDIDELLYLSFGLRLN